MASGTLGGHHEIIDITGFCPSCGLCDRIAAATAIEHGKRL
jgi:hypothetical protein